jgi:fumarate reductase flavoprotein subunit
VLLAAHEEEKRLERDMLGRSGGTERVATLRAELQKSMEASAGIYRSQAALERAAGTLQSLQERYARVALDDRSRTFNTELTGALELGYMLDVAEAIVHAALERKESRGSHQRLDHPERDDQGYLAHTLVERRSGAPPRITYQPVTITRWPPGQRVYGR